MTAVVYWIYDETCSDVKTDGYVGITKNFTRRKWQHRKNGKLTPGCKVSILYEGTETECLEMERELRPNPKIGWNLSKGGVIFGTMTGRKHSEETKRKMAEARSKWHREHPEYKDNQLKEVRKLASGKKPPEFSDKCRAIAKTRYKITKEDGTWTWGYKPKT